jgi:hypothetical protein
MVLGVLRGGGKGVGMQDITRVTTRLVTRASGKL